MTVYVKNTVEGGLTTQVIMKNAAGDKVEGASFSNSYKGTPKTVTKPTQIPKTGDETNLNLWFAALAVSGVFILSLGIMKKKQASKN